MEYPAKGSTTINASFSQDPSVDDEKFIEILRSYLEDPYYKMTAGSRHKTEAEALRDSDKAKYEDCTWDEKFVFKKAENGHKIIDHHAVAVSLAENGNFLITCPHNSLMPVELTAKEFLDFYDHVNIFRINERRTFNENPLP
jgi:cytochrome oxidase Cu insertion factor (SCO1/SenC/PrrC family)